MAGGRPVRRVPVVGRLRVMLAVGAVLLWPAPLGGVVGLTVVSGHSMEPTYHSGDLVITARQPSYAAGDIVSYVVPAGEFGGGGDGLRDGTWYF